MVSKLDCNLTPGMLAVIVVVVVVSVVLAYLIAAACVRAWTKKTPKYVYCSRCSQFLGSLNVGLPPHLVPGFQVPSYNRINHNAFHDVTDIQGHVSEHGDRPPSGTFQRLGMRTSKFFKNTNFLSPIQASPPDKTTATSEIELLTPVSEAYLAKNSNPPGAVLGSDKDASSSARLGGLVKTQQCFGASGRSVQTGNTGMLSQLQETAFMAGDDSVFYQEQEGGEWRDRREVSKMSQVRILASPPPIGASKPDGALVSKTPANANKTYRNVEPSSCQPGILGQTKMKNRIHSSVRERGQVRGSVQSEGSGKSRLSLMSRKIKLFSDERKPKKSRETQYSPLVNQNPTATEDSCGARSDFSEDHSSQNRKVLINNDETQKKSLVQEKLSNQFEINAHQNEVVNHGFIEEGNVLKTDSLQNSNELIAGIDKRIGEVKYTESEAKKVAKRGSPGNTGNVSIHQALVDIDIDGSHTQISVEPKDNTAPHGQDLGTKQKIRSSSSARKEKAQYLGKRPGFTESDITSQSEDERPRSRLASLKRSQLAGMSQSEDDRDNLLTSKNPEYPVEASNYVTTKRGTPIPSSVPMYTPKFVTVRGETNNAPDTSNYPPNSWDSKNCSNYPPNSWDPTNQDFGRNKPLDLSASSGQVNLSINSCINNLSVTAMDNSATVEGNHTSSPHSTANLADFKPEDLSMPGLDASLAFNQQSMQSPNQEGERNDHPSHNQSSPMLVQNGRYSQPVNNPMRQPPPSTSATQLQSDQALIPDICSSNLRGIDHKDAEKFRSNNSPSNLASSYDTRCIKEVLDNLDNSAGSISSHNQLLRLNHDSSKGSQDTSRGVSLDSTSTLVPSPVNIGRPPTPGFSVTPVKKTLPSPKHSLIPRPLERNHQVRSMPPVAQWSRVQEHALPPSLPPQAPQTRIDIVVPSNAAVVGVPNNTPAESLQNPAQKLDTVPTTEASHGSQPRGSSGPNIRTQLSGSSGPNIRTQLSESSGPNIRTQNVRSMPPAPLWSRVKEHALPPSLPPLAPKTRISSLEITSNSAAKTSNPVTNLGSDNVTDPLLDASKQNSKPGTLLLQMQLKAPSPHWSSCVGDCPGSNKRTSSLNEPTLPTTLPPSYSDPKALLQQMRVMPPAPPRSTLKEHTPPLPLPLSSQKPDTSVQQRRSMPPTSQQSRAKENSLPPCLPPSRRLDASVPIPSFGMQSEVDNDTHYRRIGERNASMPGSGVPISDGNLEWTGGTDRRPPVPVVPVPPGVPGPWVPVVPSRAMIPQSVAGQPNSQVAQISSNSRTRSTTESSHPASLSWDSYNSDPSFVPKRQEDLEDFTLSSESGGDQLAYRSNGEGVQYRDLREDVIERINVHLEDSRNENQASIYLQSGVRTRSQSR